MRGFSVCAALAVVLFAAGCGGGGGGGGGGTQATGEATKSADAVVADALKAAQAASSVHISGQGTQDGKPIGIDLTLVRGKGATGSISLHGAKIDLVVIGHSVYLRAGTAFWKQVGGGNAMAGQLFANKWLKVPTNDAQLGSFANLTNANSFFKMLNKHGKLENKGVTTYKGQSVVAIDDATEGGTLYVAASGTPYPAAVVKAKGSNSGAISFDNWNQSVTLTPPKGALDFSKLGG